MTDTVTVAEVLDDFDSIDSILQSEWRKTLEYFESEWKSHYNKN